MRAIVIVAILSLVAAPTADARHKRHLSKPETFEGSCEFSGAVTFTPPMTNTPQPVAQHADAPGSCEGTFTDRLGRAHAYTDTPVRYRAESSGDSVSCAFGLAEGEGTLSFPDGDIAFTMHEYRPVATPLIELDGKAGGSAWMAVTPSQSSDPVAAVQACNGDGLKEFQLDAHLRTTSNISG